MRRLCLLLVLLVFGTESLSAQAPRLPDADLTSGWYHHTTSPTAIVFVHGIFSNNVDCWLAKATAEREARYWPQMVAEDPAFQSASVFLGGYYTDVRSNNYDIRQGALDLTDALQRRMPEGRVLDKQNIIFVAHSTGGIVVRDMLVRRPDLFAGKNVGLVLMASPSMGSYWANRGNVLTRLYGNRMAGQLRYGNPYLTRLDADFRDLHQSGRLRLAGIERCENRMIVPVPFWFDQNLVVDERSCATYFNGPRILAGTDHFSAVKPDSRADPSYVALVDFYRGRFDDLVRSTPVERLEFDVTMQPKGTAVKDTIVEFPMVTLRAPSCSETVVDTARYALPGGWKLTGVIGPTVARIVGAESSVETRPTDHDVAVIARAGGGTVVDGQCLGSGLIEYVLRLEGRRPTEMLLPEYASENSVLQPENSRVIISYPHADRGVRPDTWTWRVSVRGTTRTGRLLLDLTERHPERGGVMTLVTADGKMVVDASKAFR